MIKTVVMIVIIISGQSVLPVGPCQVLKSLASEATISGYMNDYFLHSDTERLHFQPMLATIRSVQCLESLHDNYCEVM